MAESRQYLIGSMPRTLETNLGIASFLQTEEFFGLGLDYDLRVPDLLQRGDARRGSWPRPGARSFPPAPPSSSPVRMPAESNEPPPVKAVFFDVDFTLIYPGPTFQGEGYRALLRRSTASTWIRRGFPTPCWPRPSFSTTSRITSTTPTSSSGTRAGSSRGWVDWGRASMRARPRSTHEWAACQHFILYDDVTPVLRELAARGIKVGLISNSHRCWRRSSSTSSSTA